MPRVHKFCATLAALIIAGASCAQAQTPPPDSPAGEADDSGLKAVTLKFNAYVGFMNRTLRAAQSIDRYKSWVNMKTGPTGRESIIYGLYEVYDTTREAAAATAALTQEPLLPELDAAMRDYIAANGALAPILNEASAYYDRKDYKDDKMAGGIALHTRIVAAAGPFLAARARLDAIFTAEKAKVDAARLAAIEKREGRKANWHVANVMMRAQRVMDLLPSGAKPAVGPARRGDPRICRRSEGYGHLRRKQSEFLLRVRIATARLVEQAARLPRKNRSRQGRRAARRRQ
jgi:Protein of unknown function (DUF3829)